MTTGQRGQRLYDWWSEHRLAFSLLYDLAFLGREQALRSQSIEALDLDRGDGVLELGCGPGNSFAPLREKVGDTGLVVGVDYSQGMVNRARERIRTAGWENVHVVRGDATRPGVEPDAFDAMYAAMSLSAMPDPEAVLREAVTRLRPGGRIAVLDARPFQQFPWTLCNLLLVPLSKRFTNWFPDVDIPEALRRTGESVSVTNANGGTIFIAHARRGDGT